MQKLSSFLVYFCIFTIQSPSHLKRHALHAFNSHLVTKPSGKKEIVVLPYKVWSHWEHWDSPLNFTENQLLSFIYNNYKFIIAAGLLNTMIKYLLSQRY